MSFIAVMCVESSDGDGILDKWENKLGLDANNPSDALKYSSEGKEYLNIERYING